MLPQESEIDAGSARRSCTGESDDLGRAKSILPGAHDEVARLTESAARGHSCEVAHDTRVTCHFDEISEQTALRAVRRKSR
jgi:hypothetical protein